MDLHAFNVVLLDSERECSTRKANDPQRWVFDVGQAGFLFYRQPNLERNCVVRS